MTKKTALITLVETSMVLSDEDKLSFIDRVPTLNDKQVDILGTFFATQRRMALDHEGELRAHFDALIDSLEREKTDQVYVGVGKP